MPFCLRLKDNIIFIPENVISGIGGMIVVIKGQKEELIFTYLTLVGNICYPV